MGASQQTLLMRSGGASDAANLLAKMVAWWDFEENGAGTQFLDAHGSNDLDLINLGTTVLRSDAGGITGRASSWPNANSSDGAQIPRSNAAFDFSGAFTFGAWFYFNQMPTDDVTRFLLGRLGGTSATQANYYINLATTPGAQKFQFLIRNAADSSNSSQAHNTGSPLTTATWYFVVGCHDPVGSQQLFYVNNVKMTASPYTGGVYSGGASNFSVAQGRRSDTTNWDTTRTVGCRIDGAFALSGTISDAEVDYLYNAGAGKSYSDVVADS